MHYCIRCDPSKALRNVEAAYQDTVQPLFNGRRHFQGVQESALSTVCWQTPDQRGYRRRVDLTPFDSSAIPLPAI